MNSWFIPHNVPSSKNSRVWTGKHFIASKSTHSWRTNTKEYWVKYKPEFLEAIKDKEFPLSVSFKFIRGSKHKFDYINPAQTIQDEMVHQGWLEDDNCTLLIPVFEQYEYSKENPGVVITIL